jgi:putative tryptophan/tyrosine transport system substrate-binding protein
MKRREFITLLGGAAAAWPLVARAQQAGKLPRRGCFGLQSMDGCFRRTPTRTGWIENRNVAIEYRWSEGRTERYAEITAEFVRMKVDVIITVGSAVPTVRQATSVIPIVFAVAN